MKIKMGLAVLLILSGLTVSGCAEKNSSVESVKREPGSELRIGIIDGSDRFAMKSNQEYTGTEPEILKKLSEFGEYRLSFKEAEGIQELIELLEKGEIDIAAGRISEGYEIGEGYISSRNYGKGGYYLVNPKNNYSDNLGIMYEQNVGLSRYIYKAGEINYSDKVNFKSYNSAESISEDVQNGSLASAVVNEREAFMLMKEDGLQIIPLLASPKESYVFLMRNTDNDLRQSLNGSIELYLDDQSNPSKGEFK